MPDAVGLRLTIHGETVVEKWKACEWQADWWMDVGKRPGLTLRVLGGLIVHGRACARGKQVLVWMRYVDLEREAEQRDGYWPAHFTPYAPARSARCIRISSKHICLD